MIDRAAPNPHRHCHRRVHHPPQRRSKLTQPNIGPVLHHPQIQQQEYTQKKWYLQTVSQRWRRYSLQSIQPTTNVSRHPQHPKNLRSLVHRSTPKPHQRHHEKETRFHRPKPIPQTPAQRQPTLVIVKMSAHKLQLLENKSIKQIQKTLSHPKSNHRPVRTMPQPTGEKHQHRRQSQHPRTALISPHRNKNIIPKPSAQRYMPSLPKFRYALGDEWLVEIVHQMNPKHQRTALRQQRIPKEITIHLKRKIKGRQPCLRLRKRHVIRIKHIHHRSQIISHRHLQKLFLNK